jgi:hypothetical protein
MTDPAHQLPLFSDPAASPPTDTAAPSGWADCDVIYRYTRREALDDGVLVDVSETAREAGFVWPVAVTAAVWARITAIPPRFQGIQSVAGRLWDVLFMAHVAIRRAPAGGTHLRYALIMHHERRRLCHLKLVTGPGDHGEPVVTIMLPDED